MDKLVIEGGRPLSGTVEVSGAKNAALPAMAASLLASAPVTLSNIPAVRDVDTMARLLRTLGARAEVADGSALMDASGLSNGEAPYDLVRTMRASVLVLGPLVARLKRARVSLPGGCAIGIRPIDVHLAGLSAMGANVGMHDGYVEVETAGLHGAAIQLKVASVTGTENLMMAATLASGTTVISNAAREPEVVDLSGLLNAMGAKVSGAGTDTVTVEGVSSLGGASHRVVPDRIEAGTYLILSLLTGNGLEVRGAGEGHLAAISSRVAEAGGALVPVAGGIRTSLGGGRPRSVDIVTQPYPGFPTDLQAQWMTAMAVSRGSAVIRETLFENRFQHASELARMGADITVKGETAVVRGVERLNGAPVMVSDLRAGASLVLAALIAKGRSEVNRIYHLDRGYERMVGKLEAVGAAIRRMPG